MLSVLDSKYSFLHRLLRSPRCYLHLLIMYYITILVLKVCYVFNISSLIMYHVFAINVMSPFLFTYLALCVQLKGGGDTMNAYNHFTKFLSNMSHSRFPMSYPFCLWNKGENDIDEMLLMIMRVMICIE